MTTDFTGMNGKGYGMPSSHAQFVAFFAVSLSLFVLVRHKPHTPHTSTTHVPTSFIERLALSLLAVIGAAMVAESRIYLNYHSPRQVLAGCAAGAGFALIWFGVTSFARSAGWVEWGLDLPLAKYCRLRDLLVHEDLVDAGWERWTMKKRSTDGTVAAEKNK